MAGHEEGREAWKWASRLEPYFFAVRRPFAETYFLQCCEFTVGKLCRCGLEFININYDSVTR